MAQEPGRDAPPGGEAQAGPVRAGRSAGAQPAAAERDLPGTGGAHPEGLLGLGGALRSDSWAEELDVAGEPACMAHLVCLCCGAVLSEGHQPGCSERP